MICWNFLPFCLCFCLQDGQRGHLEGLASVYCELLMAPFGDILSALENARQAAWAERSPLHPAGGSSGGASGSGGSGLSAGGNGGIGGIGGMASGSGNLASGSGCSVAASSSGLQHRQQHGHRGHSTHGAGLPNSHSQPIYVPGKYSVCMTQATARTATHKKQQQLQEQHSRISLFTPHSPLHRPLATKLFSYNFIDVGA